MEARLAGRAGAKEPAGLAIARVASVELAAQAGLAELAELAARVGLVELAELAAQVGLAALVELAAQAELVELAAQEGLAELAAQVAQEGLAELEIARVAALELEIAQVAVLETKHLAAQAAVVLRTRSVTAAHRRGLVPVPKRVGDLAAAAETTRAPAAAEAAKAWAAEE
jgi:hypothetical protein